MTPDEKVAITRLRTAILTMPGSQCFLPAANHMMAFFRRTLPDLDEENLGRVLMAMGSYYAAYDDDGFAGDRDTVRILTNIILTAAEIALPWNSDE